MFGNLLENPAIKKAAFGQLKALIKGKNLEFLVIALDESGEIDAQLYRKGEAKIVLNPDFKEPEKTT
jgi:hypothetical protein